jgi:hypothetical protein
LLAIHKLEAMPPRKPPHLLEPLDRHQRGQRLALALDDEFVVAQGDSIQHVPDSLPNVHRRYLGGHSGTPSSIIVAIDAMDNCVQQDNAEMIVSFTDGVLNLPSEQK